MFKKAFSPCQIAMFIIVLMLSVQSDVTMAEAKQLSDHYLMRMEPPLDGIEIEENEIQNIMDFFHKAERAIKSKNIDALMALYSDRYINLKNGDKEFAKGIWNKIFARFDDISSRHTMKLIGYDKAKGQAITECSGLLVGIPKGESTLVTIDKWDDQLHILIKEGNWTLFGNAGKSAQRYGEKNKKIHPLF